ncbi:MAG TPA: glucoamylase family protein [Terriglobia bacterium]|nr:glucoamylase family protein [Terriglobia bacterium]
MSLFQKSSILLHSILTDSTTVPSLSGVFSLGRKQKHLINPLLLASVVLLCGLPAGAQASSKPSSTHRQRPRSHAKATVTSTNTAGLSPGNTDLVDDLSRRAFRYFWEWTDPNTGLTLDRARADGEHEGNPNHVNVASIAATGFGLTAFCIAAEHRWISRETARERVLPTLRYFAYSSPQEHGWFYHYLDSVTGQRRWNSEVSSIDTALLLAGVLTVRQYFSDDPEIVQLATYIYDRVDFPWMMDGSKTYFSHGWTPESGFFKYRWDTYSELMILYVLGIGSPTNPIAPYTWNTWKLPIVNVGDYTFVGGGPLFIQQYSQAWIDLRDRVAEFPQTGALVPQVNYFANAVAATRAEREAFTKDLSGRFPGYSENVWGLTASDSVKGYRNWGGSLSDPRIDGTVTPSAAAGSLMFAPDICIPAMRAMLVKYGKKIYGRYGFADAFNPTTGWVSEEVIGIDVGITLLSADNLRTGDVWKWFMSNPEPERALDLVGLVKRPVPVIPSSVAVTVADGAPKAGKEESDSSPEIETALTPGAPIPASSFRFAIPIPAWMQTPSSQQPASTLPPAPSNPAPTNANAGPQR